MKYGQAIGRTTADVKAGDHIHSHNLHFENDRLAATANSAPEPATAEDNARTFMGYRRDGLGRDPQLHRHHRQRETVPPPSAVIADEANRTILPHYEGIDGFVPIVHDQAATKSTGDGMAFTARLPAIRAMSISAAY